MIEVLFKTRDKKIVGLEVSGHAGFADSGKDIVCSAASVLTINSINTLEKVLKLKDEINYYQEDNLICLEIFPDKLDEKSLRDTQLILRSFELGMTELFKQYQEIIGLYYEEV